ncbi:hypothetical protein [Corynebacterium heidelbergense]|nr:hypothetical protein [Corynebacterium heidelbergense]
MAPADSVLVAGQRVRGMLRHPRSRMRPSADWVAPQLDFACGGVSFSVLVSRHRIPPTAWQRLTGQVAPTGDALFLATVSISCSEEAYRRQPGTAALVAESLLRCVSDGCWHTSADTELHPVEGARMWTWHFAAAQGQLCAPVPGRDGQAA